MGGHCLVDNTRFEREMEEFGQLEEEETDNDISRPLRGTHLVSVQRITNRNGSLCGHGNHEQDAEITGPPS